MTWLLVTLFILLAVRAVETTFGTITVLPAGLLSRPWGLPPCSRPSLCQKPPERQTENMRTILPNIKTGHFSPSMLP